MPVQNLIRCLQSKIMAARDVKEFQLLVDQLDDTESKKHNIYLFFWTEEILWNSNITCTKRHEETALRELEAHFGFEPQPSWVHTNYLLKTALERWLYLHSSTAIFFVYKMEPCDLGGSIMFRAQFVALTIVSFNSSVAMTDFACTLG